MKVVDIADERKASSDVKTASFVLSNQLGGFCLLSNKPLTRYGGVFYFENFDNIYKVVENIGGAINKEPKRIINKLWCVEREFDDFKETYSMPFHFNSLIYESDKPVLLDIILDVKPIFDNREWGRNYEIKKEKNNIIIKFTKKTDYREDNSNGEEEYSIFMSIACGNLDYELMDIWEKLFYEYDKERNTPPFERYVYNALKLKTNKAVFSFSKKKKDAVKESNYVFKNSKRLMKNHHNYVSKLIHNKQIKNQEIDTAYKCTLNAIDQLIVEHRTEHGIYAGFPWFVQLWARDELISLKSLMLLEKFSITKQILFRYLNHLSPDGNLFNRVPERTEQEGVELHNSDAVGWLFKRIDDFMIELKNKNQLRKYLAKKDLEFIKERLEHTIYLLRKFNTADDFAVSKPLATWMDTSPDGKEDTREGFPIEIQALRLKLYSMMYELSGEEKYKNLELELKRKVKKEFWNKKFLKDLMNNNLIRPNVFIAAYVYPNLLTKKEWETCFKTILPKLWLKWGGLATIDRKNPLFKDTYSGEKPVSYHRGDSWFWINNLAALVLYKTNKKLFKKYIDKILQSSTKEILYLGTIGQHSELSSAKSLKSEGCWAQAWSNALYIELINEMF